MDSTRRDDETAGDDLAAHPDLNALGRRLRFEMDETLRAEQHAARISAQRRATVRDRLILAEDRSELLEIEVANSGAISGSVLAVGADHVVVARGGRQCWVALQHIITLRTGSR